MNCEFKLFNYKYVCPIFFNLERGLFRQFLNLLFEFIFTHFQILLQTRLQKNQKKKNPKLAFLIPMPPRHQEIFGKVDTHYKKDLRESRENAKPQFIEYKFSHVS